MYKKRFEPGKELILGPTKKCAVNSVRGFAVYLNSGGLKPSVQQLES